MAAETQTQRPKIGPADHGRRMTLDEFIEADWTEGWLYELARGVVDVTEVPGTPHGRTVRRVARLFTLYNDAHPGIIQYTAGGAECRIRLPGMQSDRHPDQAIYLTREPKGKKLWTRWVPSLVVEIVSRGGERRDFVDKSEEYLRIGVSEYWIIDRFARKMHVLRRAGDVWEEVLLGEEATHRTDLLPGLEANVGEILGPPAEADDGLDDDGENGED